MQKKTLPSNNPESQLPASTSNDADRFFLEQIQSYLLSGEHSGPNGRAIDQSFSLSSFPKDYNRLAVTIYAVDHKRIMIVHQCREPINLISTVIARAFKFARLPEMLKNNARIQIDFIKHLPEKVNYRAIGSTQKGRMHFEVGVDGLLISGDDNIDHYFLPGDAYVRSIMSMHQLRKYLKRTLGTDYMNSATTKRFRSTSFISAKDNWHRLYRGHPTIGAISREKLEFALELAIDHIQLTQEPNGRFLYYYDAAKDSRRDHEHPKRDPVKNPYYNILRHGGGGLTCLFYEKYLQKNQVTSNITQTLDYLVANTRNYELDGEKASYIFYNRKAKLGGSGIALYLACEYQLLTGDTTYFSWARRLACHLQGEILASGEFRYYHIYLDKLISAAENHSFFSFYYPGEAVCGLARYYNLAPRNEQLQLSNKLHTALKFLLEVRPKTRADHYTKIPSDSWLMMGVNELWKTEQLRRPAYADFVYGDADKMIEQMYTVMDAPYPDYVGAFYYEYGDYPYADGARCEGLLAAYQLSVQTNDKNRQKKYWKALKLAAWSLLHLVNTEESIYSVPNPKLSLGGIRFKYTRQWFRIDTIQHVASFFAKILPFWLQEEGVNKHQDNDAQ